MNARTSLAIPAFGELIEGGLFHGILLLNGHVWGEVTAPKALEIVGPWHTEYTDVAGAKSDFDGLANTIAMAEAGSELAKQLRTLQHEGLGNWYLPARGGQLMQFANLKPLLEESEAFEDAWYWSSTQTQFSRRQRLLPGLRLRLHGQQRQVLGGRPREACPQIPHWVI
jgi:hypothetical protein